MTPVTPAGAHLERLGRRALVVGAIGLVASLLGLALDPEQFLRSYLLGFLFWAGIATGCLSITMLHHLSGGTWGLLIRRLLEAGTRTIWVTALAFLPIAVGVTRLFPWARPGAMEADPVLAQKALYLNVPFFLARAVFYFAVWTALAHFLNRWSLALDRGEDARVSERLRGLSGGGLVLLGLTITFASVDWGMSLDPHWFSTIYGLLFLIGQVLSALALVIVLVALTANDRPMADAIRPGLVHDLGKLLLTFTMLWAYLNLSQFIIVWSGNVSEETPFYLRRLAGGWEHIGVALLLLHFAIPFALLLSRGFKRNSRLLGRLAGVLLFMRLVDLFWLLGPDRSGHGEGEAALHLHWLDLAVPIGLGGFWLFLLARNLLDRPLLPVGEPDMRDLLAARAEGAPS